MHPASPSPTPSASGGSKLYRARSNAPATPYVAINSDAPRSSDCQVSLQLLMDESYSISADNWKLQVQATADAITHPEVLDAIRHHGGVAMMAQAFDHGSRTMVGWEVIKSEEDAHAFAQKLRQHTTPGGGSTEIGGAVNRAISNFPQSPCISSRQIVDISTDGENSDLSRMHDARAQAVHSGITINAIGVGGR